MHIKSSSVARLDFRHPWTVTCLALRFHVVVHDTGSSTSSTSPLEKSWRRRAAGHCTTWKTVWREHASMTKILLLRERLREVLWWARLCASVCPRGYLRNYTCDLYQICCACCLWPWLGPPPASLRYVMYFWFCGWHYVSSLQWAV